MNAPDPIDLSDDLSRLRSTLDRVDGLHRRLVDEYKVGTGDSPTRSLLLRDLDNAFGDAAKLAAIDRPVFIEAYTRFSGAVEALDRTVARIDQRLLEGQHDPHDPLARTAVRLLDEAALDQKIAVKDPRRQPVGGDVADKAVVQHRLKDRRIFGQHPVAQRLSHRAPPRRQRQSA